MSRKRKLQEEEFEKLKKKMRKLERSMKLDSSNEQFKKGANYNTLNTHRSALNLISDVGKCELIERFMKGVFKMKPTFPKYDEIWDPLPVLSFAENLSPLQNLTLKDLTLNYTDRVFGAFQMLLMIHVCLASVVIGILCYYVIFIESLTDKVRHALHLGGWISVLFYMCMKGQTIIDEVSVRKEICRLLI
ncbi:unnamed protein product [Acanthoscelides obtectus]|uniref:Uncharacterized protein n=1 Tax=Acanthoscelides obtectus TaxID=200917 RepID=A0A9P0MFZ8_ACAOB|nr:unnamed protein product [Acanthoscelides obtectus]CAK1627023.1 hypothetical protein AOBTE_LOCUS4231 [Acanthoscelides obtectus]